MEALQWTIGILVSIQTALVGFLAAKLWSHVEKCAHVSTELGRMDADLERMKQDIGTHNTGMRGEIHSAANMCQQHELRIVILERK